MPGSVLACSWPTGRLFFLYTVLGEIVERVSFAFILSVGVKNTRQKKILKLFVNVAECPGMPAHTFKSESVGCEPAPNGFGAVCR